MAAALLKKALESHAICGVKVESAGLWVAPGSTVSPNSVKALALWGIDISGHVPRMLDPDKVREADLILTMTRSHKEAVVSMYPEAAEKVFTMREYAYGKVGIGGDVLDPYGGPLSIYEKTASELAELAKSIAARWKNNGGGTGCASRHRE